MKTTTATALINKISQRTNPPLDNNAGKSMTPIYGPGAEDQRSKWVGKILPASGRRLPYLVPECKDPMNWCGGDKYGNERCADHRQKPAMGYRSGTGPGAVNDRA